MLYNMSSFIAILFELNNANIKSVVILIIFTLLDICVWSIFKYFIIFQQVSYKKIILIPDSFFMVRKHFIFSFIDILIKNMFDIKFGS